MTMNTKQKLINKTIKIINENGLESLNMRNLGEELGLSRSAIYRHFKSKEDLIAEIVTLDFVHLNNKISTLIKSDLPSKERIYNLLQSLYTFGIQNPERYKLMFKTWDKDKYPELHKAAAKLYLLIENIIKLAFINNTISTKHMTAILSSFIFGLLELNSSGHLEAEKGLNDHDILIKTIIDLTLN